MIDAEYKKSKSVGKLMKYISHIVSLVSVVFCGYQVVLGLENKQVFGYINWQIYLVIGLIFFVGFVVSLVTGNRVFKTVDLKLFPDEKMIKEYDGITWSGIAAVMAGMNRNYLKKVTLTDKRIVLSANVFGIETYHGSMSLFYNEDDYKRYKKFPSSVLKDIYLKDDSVYIAGESKTSPIWQFKDDKDFIFQTIAKYRKG